MPETLTVGEYDHLAAEEDALHEASQEAGYEDYLVSRLADEIAHYHCGMPNEPQVFLAARNAAEDVLVACKGSTKAGRRMSRRPRPRRRPKLLERPPAPSSIACFGFLLRGAVIRRATGPRPASFECPWRGLPGRPEHADSRGRPQARAATLQNQNLTA
jgi:hypothetical protein